MAIADRVKECITKYCCDDLDNSLIQLCIALDATAKNEYSTTPKVGERFKRFIRDNHDVITFFTLNGNIIRGRFQVGDITFDDLVYRVLRCGLLHEAKLPQVLKFEAPGGNVTIGDKWCLPKTFIIGALLAVVGANSNGKLHLSGEYAVNVAGKEYGINQLWGRIEVIRAAIYAGRDV